MVNERYSTLLLPLAIAVSGVAYYPLLSNYFAVDDFVHLYNIANNGALEFVLTPYGGHILLVRNAIFVLFYKLFGLDAGWYFLSVLATHLVNVYLLYRVVEALTQSRRLACFGAILWGMSPENEGALGWYSAYAEVLLTTIALWLFYDLLRVANQRRSLSAPRLFSWHALLLAGITCYGNGIAFAMTFGAVAFLVLPRSRRNSRAALALCSLVIVVPLVFPAFHRLYLMMTGNWDLAITVTAALATQWARWPPIFAMLSRLFLCGTSSLALPPMCTGDAAALPLCEIMGAACLSVIVVGSFRSSGSTRRRILGFALAAFATYAIIAAGRAPLLAAQGKNMAWAAAQFRYHYFGPVITTITIVLCLL